MLILSACQVFPWFSVVRGSGTITTESRPVSDFTTIQLDGAGNSQGSDLASRSTAIEINGLGNGTVWASETLQITTNGGGSVDYYGSPQLTQQISGLGDVSKLGDK
jgi:hypothetical protein